MSTTKTVDANNMNIFFSMFITLSNSISEGVHGLRQGRSKMWNKILEKHTTPDVCLSVTISVNLHFHSSY